MKIKNLVLLTSFFLMGSQVMSSQSKKANLPVIDFSKNYPTKDIRLQDIADMEYIPLETTDDVLLSDKAVLSSVTDKYILVYEPLMGDIFVFNRTGKIYAHFNHKGQSGQEYPWIRYAIFDERNGEIFVCNQSIQVYSLNGKYKRTLMYITIEKYTIFQLKSIPVLIVCEDKKSYLNAG
ncbi:MAG: 6-bladed beta-propeller [Parabacteroides sp.]|nr:6-bladed beta-propeller [Parabacteroides sp.]